MNKKVLIISSTPRKGGNSDKLCDAFAEGAKEAGRKLRGREIEGSDPNAANLRRFRTFPEA